MGYGFSQATGFAIYGVGENIQISDPASLSLGNSSFFSGNTKNISIGSPSTLWRSALTRFAIHSGMNYLKTKQFPKQYQQSLTSFSLFFPVGNKKVFGFGIQPVYRTNKLEITDKEYQFIGANESITGSPIVINNTYIIDGGISELFWEYSQKLSPHFSGGIKYSFLFGTQHLEDKLYTYALEIDTTFSEFLIGEIYYGDDTLYAMVEDPEVTEINKFSKFSGSTLTMEGRYTGSKQELVCRASVNGSTKILTKIIQSINNEYFTNNFDYTESMFISNIELGYHYQFVGNAGFIIEVHKKNKLNIPEAVALFNIMPPKEHSIHLGTYYQVSNPNFGFWNNLNIRGGAYLKELDFTGGKFLDYGGTLGLGIEYLGNTQSIDFALRAGKKESRILDGMVQKLQV